MTMTYRKLSAICFVISLSLVAALFVGCSNLKQSAQASVAADLSTTGVAIASGIGVEANPLTPTAAGILVGGALRLLVINEIDKQAEPQRTENLAKVSSLTWGIAASNLAIMASGANPIGLVVGIVTAFSVWQSTENERLFSEACAYFRATDATVKCEFKG